MSEELESAVASAFKQAVEKTSANLMGWAVGPDNTGHLSREAHHICIHIATALRLLESNFRTALANQKGQDHE